MKPRPLAVVSALALVPVAALVLGLGARARQPDDPSVNAHVEAQPDAGMLNEDPGPQHHTLTDLAGSWTWTSVFRMDETSAGADPDTGTAEITQILGGRFIQVREVGAMMGDAFESLKTYGYNNAAGLYEGTWLYTGSTATMRLRGLSEDGGRITVFQAQYATGPEENQRFLVTLSIRDHDRFSVTLVALLENGAAGPRIETTYTRER